MINISAVYYDGISSKAIPVSVCFYRSGEVLIKNETFTINAYFQQLKIAARLGNARRNIFLPDGSKLETDNNDAIDQACSQFETHRFQLLRHQLERHWAYVLTALLFTIGFSWVGIEFGMPVAAKWVVKGIPSKIEQQIGDQALDSLDNWLLSKSTINTQQQNQLRQLFEHLFKQSAQQRSLRLIFRKSELMGANALALPGGLIVLTDDFVMLAENEQQIMAVIAHEMGHLKYQHGLRSMLQDSITALFLAGVLGDISSITSLSVALPTFLVETHYSRKFELEADQFAIQWLQQHDIKLTAFSDILNLLQQAHDPEYEFDYLSSHPSMDTRLSIIHSAQSQ